MNTMRQDQSVKGKMRLSRGTTLSLIALIHLAILEIIILNVDLITLIILRPLLSFLYLFFVPGFIIINLAKIDDLDLIELVIYSIGLSLSLVIAIGALLVFILPLFSISQPLSKSNILIAYNLFISFLILIYCLNFLRSSRDKAHIKINTKFNKSDSIIVTLWAFLTLFMSILGTQVFNIFGVDIGLILFILSVSVFPLIIARSIESSNNIIILIALIMVATSLMFFRSLISNYPNGFDIMYNYAFVKLTLVSGQFHFYISNNYASILSPHVLIPVYYHFSMTPLPFIYKLIIPAIYSIIVPATLYKIYFSIFKDKFISTYSILFLILSSSFFLKMPMLVKQQLSEIFLSLMLFALICSKQKASYRFFLTLSLLFGFSMIVSHYTVSYLFIIICYIYLLLKQMLKRTDLEVKDLPISLSFVLFITVVTISWFMNIASGYSFITPVKVSAKILAAESSYVSGMTTAKVHGIGTTGIFILTIITLLFIAIGLMYTLIKLLRNPTAYADTLEGGYFLLAISASMPLIVYFGGFGSLDLPRFVHLMYIFTSPYILIGFYSFYYLLCKISKNFKVNDKLANKLIIPLFLMLFFIFNSGMVNELTNEPPIGVLGFGDVEHPIISTQDVYCSAFLLSHADTLDSVWVDGYVGPPIFNGGYIKAEPKLNMLEVIGRSEGIKPMGIPLDTNSFKKNNSYFFFTTWNTQHYVSIPKYRSSGFRLAELKKINLHKGELGVFLMKECNKIYDDEAQIWKYIKEVS